MSGEQIPRGSTAVIDSSVLFAMGGPSNVKYQAFERFVTRRDIEVRIPDHVAEELGESPDAYSYQRDRLQAAQNSGWLECGIVDFSNPDVSNVVDRTRTRMDRLSDDDVTEDEIEKADTVLAGLAYQYATGESDHVAVLVSDTLAEQAIGDVLDASGVGDRVTVGEGRKLLNELDDQSVDER
jgi:hypothetical protein